jgi:cell wall-associated NlpC family hydrolase
MRRVRGLSFAACAALLLTACAGAPQRPAAPSAGDGARIAYNALAQIGRPYRYGGTTPQHGFDCSGLVQYAIARAGFGHVPRTVAQQYRAARRVALDALRPGDVLFFHFSRARPTHDAIYIGNHQFVHAPSSGGKVRRSSLENPYWRRHLLAAGRLR